MKKAPREVKYTVEYDPKLVLEQNVLPTFKRYSGDKVHTIIGAENMYQQCNGCHSLKNEKEYNLSGTIDQYGRRKLRNDCRECQNANDRLLNLLKKQNGPPADHCQLCGKECNTRLDHCHDTLKFRGWLCQACNAALGLLKDDVEMLERAIKYLKGELNE
jgi:hypothetical protein